MITRQDYLDHKNTHEEYYAQFVTEGIKILVERHIGIERLKAAYKYETNLNSIPLREWDELTENYLRHNPTFGSRLKEAGEGFSLSTGICTLKEAARQLIRKEIE